MHLNRNPSHRYLEDAAFQLSVTPEKRHDPEKSKVNPGFIKIEEFVPGQPLDLSHLFLYFYFMQTRGS